MTTTYRYDALPTSSCLGTLTIAGIAMQCPSWYVELAQFYRTPEVRGADRLLPGTSGVRAFRRRLTVSRYSLPMILTGVYDRFGNSYADAQVGLATNIAWLHANVLLPTNVGDGTRTAVFTAPGQTPVTTPVHVLGITDPGMQRGAIAFTTLELSCASGALHL